MDKNYAVVVRRCVRSIAATFLAILRHLRLALLPRAARRHAHVGKPELWEMKRTFQYRFLVDVGLKPEHFLLDVGCGTLRGGVPLIDYLDEGHYCGLERRSNVLDEARAELRETGLESKEPLLLHVDDLSSVDLPVQFDIIWAFSVLIHMSDDILNTCLTLVRRHLKDGGRFFANVKIGSGDEGHWQSFPVVWRSMAFYQNAAARQGFIVDDMGDLKSLGHHSGIAAQDVNRMLRFQIDHKRDIR